MGVSLDPAAWGPNAHYAMSFLAMDPPDQTRLRSLVSRGFTPRRVAELEPQIRAIAREYLDAGADGGEPFDFIDEFAGRLPMDVISEMMGVPRADRAELRRLADAAGAPAGGRARRSRKRASTPAGHPVRLLRRHARGTRRAPADDLTSALVAAEVDGDRLADTEIVAFLFLMIVAGNETTTKLLGNARLLGARHPDQLGRVLADPDAASRAGSDETLRYDTSTQLLARYLRKDVALHGRVAPAGSQLVLLLGSANRDERGVPRPRPLRHRPRHLAARSASAPAGTTASARTWPGSRRGSRSTS